MLMRGEEGAEVEIVRMRVLKRNKYVCILSIAVMTLLYIMATYDYHIRYVHHACLQGSGCNSYQASCVY